MIDMLKYEIYFDSVSQGQDLSEASKHQFTHFAAMQLTAPLLCITSRYKEVYNLRIKYAKLSVPCSFMLLSLSTNSFSFYIGFGVPCGENSKPR